MASKGGGGGGDPTLLDRERASLETAHATIAALSARVAALELALAATEGIVETEERISLLDLPDDTLGNILGFLPDACAAAASLTSRGLHTVFSYDGASFRARAARASRRVRCDERVLPHLRRWLGSWRGVHALLTATGGALGVRGCRCLIEGTAGGAFVRVRFSPEAEGGASPIRAITPTDALAAPELELVWRGGWEGHPHDEEHADFRPAPLRVRAVLHPHTLPGEPPLPAFFVAGPYLLTGMRTDGAPPDAPRSLIMTLVGRAWASDPASTSALVATLPRGLSVDAWGAAVREAAAVVAGARHATPTPEPLDVDPLSRAFAWPGEDSRHVAGLAGAWCLALQPLPPIIRPGPAPPSLLHAASSAPASPLATYPHAALVVGVWRASYGPHGCEILHIALVDGDRASGTLSARAAAIGQRGTPTDAIGCALVGSSFDAPIMPTPAACRHAFVARKVVGDANVPSGAVSFVAWPSLVLPTPQTLRMLDHPVTAEEVVLVNAAMGGVNASPHAFRQSWEDCVLIVGKGWLELLWLSGGFSMRLDKMEDV